jgi:hypothetical protein
MLLISNLFLVKKKNHARGKRGDKMLEIDAT